MIESCIYFAIIDSTLDEQYVSQLAILHATNAGLTLGHNLRRCPNIIPA